MLYYSYISSKTENSVLGDDAICIYDWFLMAYCVACSKMESGIPMQLLQWKIRFIQRHIQPPHWET